MSDKLLVPLDGAKPSEAVLPWAAAWARARELTLLLVRVVLRLRSDEPDLEPDFREQHVPPEWRDAAAYLGSVKVQLEDEGLPVETVVRNGVASNCILDVANEVGAVGIAMATRGRGGLRRLFLGSVAEGLVHEATVPLLLVPARAKPTAASPALARLLVPLDGSALAERALDRIADVAPVDATVTLVRVVAPISRDGKIAQGKGDAIDEEATRQAEVEADTYLRGVVHRLHSSGVRAQFMTVRGHAAAKILTAAHYASADVIVMTSHGRTGPVRWRLGSVADEIIRQGDRPVLLVRTHALATRAATAVAVHDVLAGAS